MPQQPSAREAAHKASKIPHKDEREQRIEWLATRNQYFVLVAGLFVGATHVLLASGYARPLLAVVVLTLASVLFLLVQWFRLGGLKTPDERARQLVLKSFSVAFLLVSIGFVAFWLATVPRSYSGPWTTSTFLPLMLSLVARFATLLVRNGTSEEAMHYIGFWTISSLVVLTYLHEVALWYSEQGLAVVFRPSLIFVMATAYLAFLVVRHDRLSSEATSDE